MTITTDRCCNHSDISDEKIDAQKDLGELLKFIQLGLPGGTVVKNLPANAGDAGDGSSISGSGRFPGVGNGNPLQSSCLENSMCRGAWLDTVHGIAKSRTQLSD